MSVELLSKQTAGVISAVIKQPHWEKNQLQNGLKQVLIQKRERASSQIDYLELLLRNVTFLYENTNGAKAFLAQCIEEEQFFSQENFHSFMLDVRSQVKNPGFLAENMPRFKQFVYKGVTFQEQVLNAEVVYYNCKLVNDMMIDFISTFLHPNNRDFMIPFMEYASNVVVDTVSDYCKTYSSLLLDNIFAEKI